MRTAFMIGIGGFIGSVLRYWTAYYFTKVFTSSFPVGTFIVNLVGCIFIGVFYGLSERNQWLTPQLRIFLTTGLCGGFTTFSSFAFENITLIQSSEYRTFAIYSVSSFALGLLGVLLGSYITKL